MTAAIEAALGHAGAVHAGEAAAPTAALALPERIVAIGDPQTSCARFFGALAAHDLLGADGWLRPDVRLVAMGDYFDYHAPELALAQIEGVRLLGWLAAHARDHVAILLGNHDAARVMEFASVTDERFREAARAATPILALPRAERGPAEAAFVARFPEIATPGYAARDFNAFTVEQRRLVQRLLLDRRFDLAATAAVKGQPALLTHAGITKRELGYLCVRDHHVQTIADALNDRLAAAIRHVEDDWRAGGTSALSLAPLHLPGAGGEEGGGLLYHRPSDPERPGADPAWEQAVRAPRRYDPRSALPRGLVQVAGHTGHKKASSELPRWNRDADGRRGGVRTLRAGPDDIDYRRGVHPGGPRDAVLYLIDPEMHYVDRDADVAVLDLG